jgi:hypothetical protein
MNQRDRQAIDATWAIAAALLAIGLCTCPGCAERTTATVTGEVAIDGVAVREGSIAFFPVNGKGTTAGAEILEGRYTAEVPLGQVTIEIRVPKVVGEKKLYDTPDSPVKSLMAESLPARYNDATELQMDVQPGENRKDFALSSE